MSSPKRVCDRHVSRFDVRIFFDPFLRSLVFATPAAILDLE
jgi:hypothetical protein